ncbi:MAG: hypothetical protein WC070_05160 [Candidatus Magasanikbacteria bacterium]
MRIALIIVLFGIIFNINSKESKAQPAAPVVVDNIGSCIKSDLKESLKCCQDATGRVGQCRHVVREYFRDETRKTAATKSGKTYEPTKIGECVSKSNEVEAVKCCSELPGTTAKSNCMERVMASVEVGIITVSTDDDFRASSRKRALEELASRRRLIAASLRVAKLKVELESFKGDAFAKLEVLTKAVDELPSELRKEFGEALATAITQSEEKCAQAIGVVKDSLDKRIDELNDTISEHSKQLSDHESRIAKLETRSSFGLQVGGWGAFDKVGAIGGIRADVLLKWQNSHFQLGGGLGGSPSGLAWMAEVSGFYHVSDSFFFGGGVLAAADASDLAETDHVLMGISPSVQLRIGETFVVEVNAVLGAIVRPGGEWTPSAGGLVSGSFNF